jgi:integrase
VQLTNLRPGTWENYRIHVQAHIVPAFCPVELQRLAPAQLNAFYRHLLTEAGKDGRGLASKTVRNIHNILHRGLKDAMRWGYVVRNVADAADPPKGKSAEMRVWTPEQLRVFLDHVREDDLYAAWLLISTTGMRRGELAGLRWVDVDLEARRLSIRRPRVVVANAPQTSEPKTARGRRALALDPVTVAALRRHRARQLEHKLAVGARYPESGWCSPGWTGHRSIRCGSRAGSSSTPAGPGCRRSVCMICGIATPAPPWLRVCRPR